MKHRTKLNVFIPAILTFLYLVVVEADAQRRIALDPSAMARVKGLYEHVVSATGYDDPRVKYLAAIASTRDAIANKALGAGVDYSNPSINGYAYCVKAASSLGLLGALGDTTAASQGRSVLVNLARSFSADRPSPTTPSGVNLSSQNAGSWITDEARPIPDRIRAFNLLSATQGVVLPSRGSKIYLESSYMALCLAFGRDWLPDEYTANEKQLIEIATRELLLWFNNLHDKFFVDSAPSAQRESNWNAVMNGGSGVLGVTALASTGPIACIPILTRTTSPQARAQFSMGELATERVCQSITGIRYLWRAFSSSGAYVEGPEYWLYGMPSYALFADVIKRSLGRVDFDTTATQTYTRGAQVQQQLFYSTDPFWRGATKSQASAVDSYSFGDSLSRLVPSAYPFVYAGRVGQSLESSRFGWDIFVQQIANEATYFRPPSLAWAGYAADWSRILMLLEALPVISSPTPGEIVKTAVSPDGRLDLGIMKTGATSGSWSVHQKGGSAHDPHAHLDSGSFTLRVGESTWLADLGRPPGGYPLYYWTVPEDARYFGGLNYFPKGDLSHNLVTITGRPLNPRGRAVIRSSRQGSNPSDGAPLGEIVWDTTSLYTPVFETGTRTFSLIERGKYTSLDVRDEFILPVTSSPSSGAVLATWRAVSCGNSVATVDKTEGAAGLPRVRLERPSLGALTNERLDITVISPSIVTPIVIPADPNTQASLRPVAPYATESSNPGCSVITVPLTSSHIITFPNGRRGLRVAVRMQRPL